MTGEAPGRPPAAKTDQKHELGRRLHGLEPHQTEKGQFGPWLPFRLDVRLFTPPDRPLVTQADACHSMGPN